MWYLISINLCSDVWWGYSSCWLSNYSEVITSRVVIVLHFLPQLGDIYHPCICIHRCVFLEFLCVSLLTPTAFQVFSAWSLALLSKTALDSIYSRNYNIKADMDCYPVRLYMLTNLWDVRSCTFIHSRRSTGFHTQLWPYGEGESGVLSSFKFLSL